MMGDRRFDRVYEELEGAPDRSAHLAAMEDEAVIHALASASRRGDPYLANVLATEAVNRQRRAAARGAAFSLGALTALSVIVFFVTGFAIDPHNWRDEVVLLAVSLSLALGGCGAWATYARKRRSAYLPL